MLHIIPPNLDRRSLMDVFTLKRGKWGKRCMTTEVHGDGQMGGRPRWRASSRPTPQRGPRGVQLCRVRLLCRVLLLKRTTPHSRPLQGSGWVLPCPQAHLSSGSLRNGTGSCSKATWTPARLRCCANRNDKKLRACCAMIRSALTNRNLCDRPRPAPTRANGAGTRGRRLSAAQRKRPARHRNTPVVKMWRLRASVKEVGQMDTCFCVILHFIFNNVFA